MLQGRWRPRWVMRVALATTLVWACQAWAAPSWGPVTEIPLAGEGDVVRLVTDPAGTPKIVRATMPLLDTPENGTDRASVAMNSSGDLAALWTLPQPQFVFIPAGQAPQQTPVDAPAAQLFPRALNVAPVLLSADGNAVALFKRDVALFAVARTASGVVTPTVRLSSTDSISTATHAERLADETVLAMWTEEARGRHTLKASRFDIVTLTWSPPATIHSSDQIRPLGATLDPDGRIVAVWEEFKTFGSFPGLLLSATGSLRSAHLLPGGQWTLDAGPLAETSGQVEVARSRNGTLAVAWQEDGLDGPAAIHILVRRPGQPWLRSSPLAGLAPVVTDFRVALADNGVTTILFTSRPLAWFFHPTTNDDIASRTFATFARPGEQFSPPIRLDQPRLGSVRLDGIGVAPDGTAIARWTARGGRRGTDPVASRHAVFAEGLARPVPTSATILSVAAPSRVTAGTRIWIRARLSKAVDDATITALRQGSSRPAAVVRVAGRDLLVPVRIGPPGTSVFRLRLDDGVLTPPSLPLRVQAVASPQRLIATGNSTQLASAGRLLWLLEQPGGPSTTTVRAVDARTGRSLHSQRRVPGVQSIAASPDRVWLLRAADVVAIDADTGTPGRPIPLGLPSDPLTIATAIATRDERAWIWIFAAGRGVLLEVDEPTRRVVRRVKVRVALSGLSTRMTIAGNVANLNDFSPSTLRVDLRTGRGRLAHDRWVAGFGNLWQFQVERVRRFVPPRAGAVVSRAHPEGLIPGVTSIGPDGAWDASLPDVIERRGLVTPRRAEVVHYPNSTARAQRLAVGPIPHPTVRGLINDPSLAAVPGGAWVTVPPYGVAVFVPSSRFGR